MCAYEMDSPEFFVATAIKKTRKSRACEECGNLIPAGSAAKRVVGKWDGSVMTYSFHAECADLAAKLADVLCGGHGYLFGQLREHADELREFPTSGPTTRHSWESPSDHLSRVRAMKLVRERRPELIALYNTIASRYGEPRRLS